MWIPKTEQEIVDVVSSGNLEETVIFDAKREVPPKSIEVAKDVAAMANDGGVLIFGIGEDENKRLTILNPIPIAGTPERISSIVNSAITEPPTISIKIIPTIENPSIGYIVVIIPPSERAPHMVVVKGDHRFYGRSDKGNMLLTEAAVSRLYERRKSWEVNATQLIETEIENSPYPPNPELAYLYMIAHPIASRENLLDEGLKEGETIQGMLSGIIEYVMRTEIYPRSLFPEIRPPTRWIQRTNGLFGKLSSSGSNDDRKAAEAAINLKINFNGTTHIFYGRAASREDKSLLFYPKNVAGITTSFLLFTSELYNRSKYFGGVDFGLGITGLKGCEPHWRKPFWISELLPYDQDKYVKTKRVSAIVMKENLIELVKELVMPLVNAISQGAIDPFQSD
jgi:hypothetical protein